VVSDDEGLVVRSFRAVFELERRIYTIDRLRLNPGGVPLRGVAYLLGLVALAAAVSAMPLTRWSISWLPWYMRLIGVPLALALLLTLIRIDGRPFHVACGSLARYACCARHSTRFAPCPAPGHRWSAPALVQLADGSDGRVRRLRYRGPGVVLVAFAHRRLEWDRRRPPLRADVAIVELDRAAPASPSLLLLGDGALLSVRPRARRGGR
jgi:hypothetical protein